MKMSDSRSNKKDKNQHIQVFVRVRPANASEKNGKSVCIVDVPSNKDIVIKERPQDKLTKKFTFDKVFGPQSKQIDVYDAVVNPLVAEVLAGYNCTVFAYGQTGTGKTFTMEGVSNDPAMHWKSDTTAGIIPRTLSHLFDELRVNDAQEYTVRVSFLELYNEELFDLLSPSDDASKIRLFEDASKKGSVIIHGLEEVTVHNKSEVYKILEKGSEKRQTAATLMNAQSSRSHTVFSITIHIKENTVEGEELLKTGKMNLVDLAGSENVGRSGAVDRRAREAGNINQSLLTLGRVITALVERAPHVPYRESKLTRLLQESLGGRTKTSIIATISPASINLEETLSTLDYAHRAKNITNRPEINQKMSKKALLKEYTEEIERLRRDLAATRERNGVYLAQDNYNEMQTQIECQGKEIEEKINHIKALEEAMANKEKIFTDLKQEFNAQKQILQETAEQLEEKKLTLKEKEMQLEETELDRDVQKHLVEKHVDTEQRLLSQVQTLITVTDTVTKDVSKLHDKIGRKKSVEDENLKIEKNFREDIANRIAIIEKEASENIQNIIQFCLYKKDLLNLQTSQQCNGIDATVKHISQDLPNSVGNIVNSFKQSINDNFTENDNWLKKELLDGETFSKQEKSALHALLPKLSPKFQRMLESKLSENLQSLSADFDKKLTELSDSTMKSIDEMWRKVKENNEELINKVSQIRNSVQENLEAEKIKIEERMRVYNNLQATYTKMKELMDNEFTPIMSEAKLCYEKDASQPITVHLENVHQICNSVNKKKKLNDEDGINFVEIKKDGFESRVKKIKLDVASSLEQNWTLADTTKQTCKDLFSEIEVDIYERVNAISSYQDLRQEEVKHMREKLEKQRNTSTSYINNVNEVVCEAGKSHEIFMKEQRGKMWNSCNENKRKLDSQSVEMSEWRTKMLTQLNTTKHQVDKFLLDDLRRDQPTGSTPARKDYHYPKSMISTSPHERIIQRFKEARQGRQSCVNSDEEMNEETLKTYDKESLYIPANESMTEILSMSAQSDNTKIKVNTSTPKNQDMNNRHILRSISVSDIKNEDKKTMREIKSLPNDNMMQVDKENGDDALIIDKKRKYSRISRLSQARKVLGSSN